MRQVADAVLALSSSPTGFTASDLAEKVRAMSGEPASEYGARRAAYDIKKLRGKDMVRKIGASRRYEPLHQGPTSPHCSGVLREKVIRPLLAASTRPRATPNYPIRPRSISTTKTSASVCTPLY